MVCSINIRFLRNHSKSGRLGGDVFSLSLPNVGCTPYYKMAYGRPTGSRTSDRPRRGGVVLDCDDDDDGSSGDGDGCKPSTGINRSVSIARRPSRRHRVIFHKFRRDVPYRCFFSRLCAVRKASLLAVHARSYLFKGSSFVRDIIKTILIHLYTHTSDLYVPI